MSDQPSLSPKSFRPSNYLSEDTIAALSSPVGGAISVVRVSGPEVFAIGSRITGRELEAQAARAMFRCELRDGNGHALDDAMAVLFRGPRSYSGEDVLEIFLHGSPFIGSEVLKTLYAFGARPALAGEFSFRAVRNGKLDLPQARAVADLIGAANRGAVDLALEKLSGSQSALLQRMAEELRTLAALAELGIDFADQDVEEVSLPRLKERTRGVILDLEKLETSFERGSRIQEGVSIAFVGRPNAGKSSFFNALLGEDRSIVTEVAGTTRDIIREKLTLQGAHFQVTLRMEDTAGLRTGSQDSIERIGMERTHKAAIAADLVLYLIDLTQLEARSGPSEKAEIERVWIELGRPTARSICVLTKSDLVDGAAIADAAHWVQETLGIDAIAVSSVSQFGMDRAARLIAEKAERLVKRDSGEVVLTQMEQVLSVREALVHLRSSLLAMEESLFAADLRHGLVALTTVIGETLPDDILGRIFSQFCIGK